MVQTVASAAQNHLLGVLSRSLQERIFPELELVKLPLGKAVYEAGDKLSHVYFPVDAIVSLLYVMENGDSAEIAVIGNDGVVGIALFMGGDSSANRAVVQSAGTAYRLSSALIKKEFGEHGEVQKLLLRYTQALITQMAQTAVCNRHHTIHQQLARWLLLSIDRLPDNTVRMTQELIADMLGVRREGVTEAAGHLQQLGIIAYRRGRIDVLDRAGLERESCECYQVVETERKRLMAGLVNYTD